MPVYAFQALDRHGREIRETVEAADVHAAARRLRECGYHVQKIERCPSTEPGGDCPRCGTSNDPQAIRCSRCRQMLRGRMVEGTDAALPSGYVATPNADGSVTLVQVGWKRWSGQLGCLAASGFFLGVLAAIGAVFLLMLDAPAWTYVALCASAGTIWLPFVAWSLCGRTEWIAGPGVLERRAVLFGRRWGRHHRDGAFKAERRVSGRGHHRSRASFYCVSVESGDSSEELLSEKVPERARMVAVFLAQRTGWPFDDRL